MMSGDPNGDNPNPYQSPASYGDGKLLPPIDDRPWYAGITGYQWLVLTIASLGWIFDVFEGQIFVASMREAMPDLLGAEPSKGDVAFYNNVSLASFLCGGMVGGVLFGIVSDRIGRTKTMIITILVYSCFTCVTVLAQTWWHMAVLRFFVAMGVGGEWAVASAMVAEVFPDRSRARVGAIFHGSSVFGTYLAVIAGLLIVGNPALGWRVGFLIGAVPALLTLLIRWTLRDPEKWVAARELSKKDNTQRTGSMLDLFSSNHIRSTLVGVSLASIGLATFWGVHIYGKDLMRGAAMGSYGEKNAEMLGMFLTTTGGGVGLLAFGPICEWLGRRGAFLVYHLGGLVSALVLFRVLSEPTQATLWFALPIFGFTTLGMHAGYAVYFPELFPTRLRGTGGGFCFNVGRIIAAPILILGGWLQKEEGGLGLSLADTASLLSLLFLLAVVVLAFAPETKGRQLPD